jgi:hypothetical protein
MSDGVPVTEAYHENHPLKRIKACSSLFLNASKSVEQLEAEQKPSHDQECHRPGSCPSLEGEGIQNSLISYFNANSFSKESTILGSAKDPTSHLPDDMLDSSLGLERISEGSKLFPSINNMDISLELDPDTLGQFSPETYMDFRRDWPSAEETFDADNFDWVEDLMASDLPSLEYDWPWEKEGAAATLTDISSSPNTLIDFNYSFPVVEDLPGVPQNSQFTPNERFTYKSSEQFISVPNSCVEESAHELEEDRVQDLVPFVPQSSMEPPLGMQTFSGPESNDGEYVHVSDAAFEPVGARLRCSVAKSSLEIPNSARLGMFYSSTAQLRRRSPQQKQPQQQRPQQIRQPQPQQQKYLQLQRLHSQMFVPSGRMSVGLRRK